MVTIRPDLVTRWTAPSAVELPEVRLRLREHVLHPDNPDFLVRVAYNRTTVFPTVAGPPEMVAGVGVAGSLKVAQRERRRLGEAQLYWVDEDMTSLALAAADTPSREPMLARRMPAEAGLMVFAHPIGGRDLDPAVSLANLGYPNACEPGTLVMPTPIVAVSWSYWTPAHLDIDGMPDVRWNVDTPDGPIPLDRGVEGVWLTFWTPGGQGWDALPPDAVFSGGPGVSVTVGELADIEARQGVPPLRSLSETVLLFGRPLPRSLPDTHGQWAHAVYTTWQIMSQTGSARLTETETLNRPRHGRKRDQRDGVTAPGGVQLIRVHTRHRPSAQASAEDAQTSTDRRAPQWTRRWPVRPYRRNTCLNSRLHATGGCDHEETVVPGHIKGPADKPLVIADRVHVVDAPPPEDT
ncbi:hypothetical protein [Saccharothrix sp. NRRL B-16348]|uniref:hypothetical protein n=1 Tax=Saccharothrix sp. NRRL B-16348 TaxID=1415542 RepID=UPI0006ADD7EE|nr:hypothetical protein [Saccharothrix sp. NRRL B-16348]